MKSHIHVDTDLLTKLVVTKYPDNPKVRFAMDLGVSEMTVTRMLTGHIPGEPIRKLAAFVLAVDIERLYRHKKAA